MPRSKTILQSEFPYSVGARCVNKDWFSLPMGTVWEIMSNYLYFIHHAFGVQIHSFVLMSNHFHLLISTPNSNLSLTMAYFMKETSRAITKAGGRINQTYGARHFRTVISKHHYFLNSYKYIYRNPVDAGMVNKVEEYQFSTLSGLLGLQKHCIPVVEDFTLFSDLEETLRWLNTPVEGKDYAAIRTALKKPIFKLAKDPDTKKMNRLENDLL